MKDIDAKGSIIIKGVEIMVCKVLSIVSVNGMLIFQAIEKGSRKRNKDIFMYYHPEHKQLINKWFKKLFMDGMKLKHDHKIKILVQKQTVEQ